MKAYSLIIGLTALAIAATAATFSVTGLAYLFGGNFWAIVVMAGVLEFGKLVCASVAYRSRKYAPKWIKGLLIFFTIVMMFITSVGIFGFLSQSYEQVARQLTTQDRQIEAFEQRIDRFQQTLSRSEEDRQELIEDRRSLRESLSEARSQYNERGWATDLQTLERIEEQLDGVNERLDQVDGRIAAYSDSISTVQNDINRIQIEEQDITAELGPLIYISRTLDRDTDDAVLWLMMLLIFVFDPMAVTLVVAFNVVQEKRGDGKDFDDFLMGTLADDNPDGSASEDQLSENQLTEDEIASLREMYKTVENNGQYLERVMNPTKSTPINQLIDEGDEIEESKDEDAMEENSSSNFDEDVVEEETVYEIRDDDLLEKYMKIHNIVDKDNVDTDTYNEWKNRHYARKTYKRSSKGGVRIEYEDHKNSN